MFFATLALLGGIIFGERPSNTFIGLLPFVVPLIGLALIPVTRRWERMGIEKRRAEGKSRPKDRPDKA